MIRRIKCFLHYLHMSIKRPEMEVLPGNLAFFFMMMIIPLLTIIGIVISNIDVGKASVYDALVSNFPDNIASLIISIAGDSSSSIGIIALLISSLLLASNGTYSMIVTSNSIYGITKSNYFLNKIKSLILLVILVILFIILLFVPIFNNKLFEFVGSITNTDMLTSLKNRNYLNHNIKAWNESQKYPQSIVIIDLNNIKYVNDNYGHEQGDKLIKDAASTLINTQLENSEIIRSDGNEFLIYMIGYNENQVDIYTKKLSKSLQELPYGFGAAIGYSMILDEIKTIDDAINEATIEMRKDKEENS